MSIKERERLKVFSRVETGGCGRDPMAGVTLVKVPKTLVCNSLKP
jgi:hypothetical protein